MPHNFDVGFRWAFVTLLVLLHAWLCYAAGLGGCKPGFRHEMALRDEYIRTLDERLATRQRTRGRKLGAVVGSSGRFGNEWKVRLSRATSALGLHLSEGSRNSGRRST